MGERAEEAAGRERLLESVEKPARYLGTEWNAVRKDHREVDILFALAFPDAYEVGMSHLGSKILYHLLNRRGDTAGERVYAPWVDMEARLREEGRPLFALESWRPVREFDFLGFSLQYELNYTNILNMLDLAGIPLQASERGEGDPLVIAGGPCAFNAEPLAGFFDFMVLGEGEEVLDEILDLYARWKRQGRVGGRREFLHRVVEVPGVYVPSFYEVDYHPDGTVREVRARDGAPSRVKKRVLPDLEAVSYPVRPPVPFLDVIHDRIMVEVFRGCSRGCRFCHAGMVYRPVRERSPQAVVSLAGELVRGTGYDQISLASLASADYSAVTRVVRELNERFGPCGIGVSLPSLRMDSFSVDLAREAGRVRRAGLTFAPEAGSQRLRDVINKNLTEDEIMGAVDAAVEAGWDSVKLYFMVGLPTEGDEDLEGIARLVEAVSARGGRGGKRLSLSVSVSPFVPKAHTSFQWEAQDSVQVLEEKFRFLRRRLRIPGVNLSWHDPRMSLVEAVFSRGDRRLGRVLERAWRAGCRFDSWTEFWDFRRWEEAFRSEGLEPGFYANRARPRDEVFPWDHLDAGVDRDFLWEEREKAYRGETTPDCRWDACPGCGVCPELGVAIALRGEGQM
ncbi:MAG: TIGR03960 family B12-binding radical SAM protein [Firmicutes bacterium]|nr:TIGR03960 family B12-binding radical SAM protein [Bacillota bacterium]